MMLRNLLAFLLLSTSAFGGVFTIKTSLEYLGKVADTANCIQKHGPFLAEVEAFPKYTHTTKTPKEVGSAVRNFKPVVVSSYQTKNPWSSAIATTYASDKTTVYFNTRKNPRPLAKMVNTVFHEGLHLNGFSHGNNSPKGKENSVNYRVGLIAEKYVDVCSGEVK